MEMIDNDKGVVYDLTVKDNHSFIANGFIVHNTTTISKLSAYYSKRGFKTAMLGLDVHRPAAPEQLEQLAKQSNLAVFTDNKEKSAIKIYKKYKKELEKYDVVFVDTAGRHDLDKDLIKEIKTLNKKLSPTEVLLVIPADIGQAVKNQTQKFKEALNITGVIVTRMDSSAKGGGALTACKETSTPVYFITTGEKVNDLETFTPKSFISRILGMGDLETLIEKVKNVVDEKSQKKSFKRFKEGKFNMLDLYEQLKAMKNMGSISKIAGLIPGLGKAKIPKELLGTQEEKMKRWKDIINSMTPEEIEEPEILDKQKTRISRIAKGSGTTNADVRALLKQYKLIKEFAKGGDMSGLESGQLSQKQMQKLAKKFGKKMRFK